jgi:hypothetical protein
MKLHRKHTLYPRGPLVGAAMLASFALLATSAGATPSTSETIVLTRGANLQPSGWNAYGPTFSDSLGSTGGKQAAAGKSLIAIRGTISGTQSSDLTYKARFSLLVDGVIEDSGTMVITPNLGTAKPVDGQPQAPVFGYFNLASKKGTLSIFFRGVSIVVQNLDPTKDGFESEYGTWQIKRGTGKYKGWKGGGRWLNVAPPGTNHIELDGYVTH